MLYYKHFWLDFFGAYVSSSVLNIDICVFCVFVSLHRFRMFDKAKSYNTAKVKRAWYIHMLDGIYYALQFYVFHFNLSWFLRKFMHRMIVKSVVKLRPTYIINLVYLNLYEVDVNRRRSPGKYWSTTAGRFAIPRFIF